MKSPKPQPIPVSDHQTFLRSLDPDVRATLTQKRDAPGVIHLVLHAGLILALAAMIVAAVPGWPVLMLPLGILLVFLFTLLHETTHDTTFRSTRLNRSVAFVVGYVLMIPSGWFRYFHFAHHKHTHDPDRDPELASAKPQTRIQYALHISGLPLWKNLAKTVWATARGRGQQAYVPASKRAAVQREAATMIAVYLAVGVASLIAQSTLLLWVWIVPMLLGQPFLRIYLLAEHTLCPHVDDMFQNTRTTFTTGLVRWLAWNMPYHAEHHAFPTVPFHQLPKLHALTREHLQQTATGYAAFHADYRATL